MSKRTHSNRKRFKGQKIRVEHQDGENDPLRLENEELKKRLDELELKYADLESENNVLKSEIENLKSLLNAKAESKQAKKPEFGVNYSVSRNEPGDPKKEKSKKKRKNSGGRIPHELKSDKADRTEEVHLNGIIRNDNIIHRVQFAWRVIDGKAVYVQYFIFAPVGATELPSVPGVRTSRSEYGIEILLSLAFLVYWKNNSIDNACEIILYFTGLNLSKGQADSLLTQLSNDWESEYDEIAKLIAVATILYVDETGWKIGKKACYAWIFTTMSEAFYEFGVGRGKEVLERILGKKFAGTGISDDYGAYDSIFAQHQLCWAHPLRKAIELALKHPDNEGYQTFMRALFDLYYEAVRLWKDKRLSTSRPQKAAELERKLADICVRAGETVVTEKAYEKAKADDPNTTLCVTSAPEKAMINLQKQLFEKRSNMFVFVVNPEVKPDNNTSERAARPESNARKLGRTSKTESGAKRRSIIVTVFATLKKRLSEFSLPKITEIVSESLASGLALFHLVPAQKRSG